MSRKEVIPPQALSILRKTIDGIDAQILQLLARRSECVAELGEIKYHYKLDIFDINRESTIINKVSAENPTAYHPVDVATIFQAILRAGVNQQLLYRSMREK